MESIKSAEIGPRHIDVAWAAGVIDGEGSLAFYSSAIIAVDIGCIAVVKRLHEIFGGKMSVSGQMTKKVKPRFRWKVYSNHACEEAEELTPFLVEKKEQAILLSKIYRYPSHSEMRKSVVRRLGELKRTPS